MVGFLLGLWVRVLLVGLRDGLWVVRVGFCDDNDDLVGADLVGADLVGAYVFLLLVGLVVDFVGLVVGVLVGDTVGEIVGDDVQLTSVGNADVPIPLVIVLSQ